MPTSRTNLCLRLLAAAQACFWVLAANPASAQSIEDNIRPVGQVCLAGQPCEGTTGGGGNGSVSVIEQVQEAAEEVVEAVAEVATAVVEDVAEPVSDFDVAATYQQSCFACHGTDAVGAPTLGDAEAWEERMAKGMDAVMVNVMNGINTMPAKGLCFSCSEDNLRELVQYMVSQ